MVGISSLHENIRSTAVLLEPGDRARLAWDGIQLYQALQELRHGLPHAVLGLHPGRLHHPGLGRHPELLGVQPGEQQV